MKTQKIPNISLRDQAVSDFLTKAEKFETHNFQIIEGLMKIGGYTEQSARVMASRYKSLSQESKDKIADGGSTYYQEYNDSIRFKNRNPQTEYSYHIKKLTIAGKVLNLTKRKHMKYVSSEWDRKD